MARLKDKVGVVTGGGQGIGRETARRLAQEGAIVYVMEIREDLVHAACDEFLQQGLCVYPLVGDVTNREQVEHHMASIVQKHGHLDILVNNAGVIRDNLIHKMTDSDWNTVLNIHLNGMFICSQTAQSYMVKQKYGKIINLSSTSALGNRGQANYATAKAGIQGFTKTLAIELGGFGINVNAVAPGFIETQMTRNTAERVGVPFEEWVQKRVSTIALGRSGKPIDVANAVLFLASEEASFITGQVLYVKGGP